MKKIIYSIILSGLILSGCVKKTDPIFDQTPDERLAAAQNALQSALITAPGWKLFVYPKGLETSQDIKVGGLTYYVKFTADGRVRMVSDFAPAGATSISATPKESGYHLKALQRISLIFDTYNYMHIAADPDPDVSFSPAGTGGYGYGSDFNFAFTDVKPKDTMMLEGNFNKSAAVLVKATQAEMDAAFVNFKLRDIIDKTRSYAAASPAIYLTAGGQNYGVGFDFSNFMISFSNIQGGALVVRNLPSSFTTYGIHLKDPVTIGPYTFQDIYWDDAKSLYYILSGTTHVEFVSSATPVVSLSLSNVIGGVDLSTISIPQGAGLPFESPLFISKYNTAASGMLSGPYALSLDDLDFVFSKAAGGMAVVAYVYQNGVGPYVCQYNYAYSIDASGKYSFVKVSQNGNAALVVANMNNILNYIQTDKFSVDGVSTSVGFLGKMTSVQTPTFYFSGYLY